MRTRNILAGLSALAMMAFATGCNDDLRPDINQGGNTGAEDGPGIYMGVNLSMPGGGGGTRSWTDGPDHSNDGVEVGSDVENNVNEVLLVLAKKDDYGFIAASTVPKNSLTVHDGHDNRTYHARARFDLNSFDDFYGEVGDGTIKKNDAGNCEISVFVFCNPTKEIASAISQASYGSTGWTDTPAHVSVSDEGGTTTLEGSIWSSANGGSFLMSSSEIAVREIPGSLEAWQQYSTVDQVFNLSSTNGENDGGIDNRTGRGAVKVERAAARIDFRDGSKGSDNNPNNNTYDVLYTWKDNGEDDQLVASVRLTKMSLVNMCKSFYYLSRVSADGTSAKWQLCGEELPWFSDGNGTVTQSGNYLVGPYWQQYLTGLGNKFEGFKFDEYFNYAFFDNDGKMDNSNSDTKDRWGTAVIGDVLGNDRLDNWTGSGSVGSYHIWRYLTPNLIPGTDNDYQQNGISTGVVFKGKLIGNEDAVYPAPSTTPNAAEPSWPGTYDPYENERKVASALNNTDKDFGNQTSAPILYLRSGRLYHTFKNVYDAAIAASFSYTFDDKGDLIATWNRSNSLFKAVFGEGGGTGFSMTYKKGGETVTYTDPTTVQDGSMYGTYIKWKNLDGTYVNGKNDPEAEAAFKRAATSDMSAFTIYQRSYDNTDGWGYYCYYYHWIRHNDNGKNGIMAPMEFDVVRNNVYKLAVTKISALGHPRISANDPDSPNPWTPDEQTKIYMTVDAEVIPWVVRVNDIVFE